MVVMNLRAPRASPSLLGKQTFPWHNNAISSSFLAKIVCSIYIYVYINYPSYILNHPRSRRDLMGRFAYPTSFQQPSLILSIPWWLFSSRKPRVLTITMFFKKQLIWRSRGPPTRTKTHGPIRNRQWNNYHQYLHVQVTRDVFFHQPIWSKNMRKSNRITLPKDRDKTYASCQAPPQCKWILSTEATFPLPRNFRGSISFSPREIFFFTVKGQVEVTSPKKSCEPKSFIFFWGGGSKIVSFTESIPLQEIKQSTLVTPHISGDLVFFWGGVLTPFFLKKNLLDFASPSQPPRSILLQIFHCQLFQFF